MNLNGRLYALEQEASGQKRPPCAACNGMAVTPKGWDGTRERLRCAACGWLPGLTIDLGGGNPA